MDWTTDSGIKRNHITFIRLFFAVVIIYTHSYLVTGGAYAIDGLGKLTGSRDLSFGGLAFDGFFAMSGFFIAHSWMSAPDPRRFMANRIRRVVPGYVLAMLFTALVAAPLAAHSMHAAFSLGQIGRIIKRAVMLQRYPGSAAFFAHNPFPAELNVSMWSLQFEACLYVLLALAGITGLLRRKPAVIALFALAMIGFALQQLHAMDVMRWWVTRKAYGIGQLAFVAKLDEWPRLLAYFWGGVCFHSFRQRIPRSGGLAGAAVALIVLASFLGVAELALPIAGTYLLFWIAYEPRLPLAGFTKHGDFSYGTYLYAFPLQQLAEQWFPSIGPWTMFAAVTPASLLAGVISWYAVERRFLARKSKQPAAVRPEPVVIPEPLPLAKAA